jgi:thymidylate synthase ThyX
MESFSNRDKDVFLITCQKMIDRGALMSRYSRTRELDIRNLWDKEFVGDENRGEKFYERVFLEYGDESVSELVTAQVGIQNISNVLSKIIEESRIGLSYLEKSSRYVSYKEKRDGKYLYLSSEKAGIPNEFADRYEEFNNSIFDLYVRGYQDVTNYIHENFPFQETNFYLPGGREVKLGDREISEEIMRKAYESSVRSRALDETRFILPSSTLTNVGISGNARAFSRLLERLKTSGLKESDKLYEEMMRELRGVFPKLIDNIENQHGRENLGYLKNIKNYIPMEIEKEEWSANKLVKMVSWEEEDKALDKVISAYYFERTSGDFHGILNAISSLGLNEKREIINKISSMRSNRRNKVDRSFEHVYYTFEINSNFGAFRDLQRHRTLTIQRKKLSTDYGFEIPPIISKISTLRKEYQDVMEDSAKLYNSINAVDSFSSQYVVPFAFRHPVLVTLNLREAIYLTELRSTPQAHFDLRNISRKIVQEITEMHPSFSPLFKFLNTGEEELGRLSAELKKEIKKQNS